MSTQAGGTQWTLFGINGPLNPFGRAERLLGSKLAKLGPLSYEAIIKRLFGLKVIGGTCSIKNQDSNGRSLHQVAPKQGLLKVFKYLFKVKKQFKKVILKDFLSIETDEGPKKSLNSD